MITYIISFLGGALTGGLSVIVWIKLIFNPLVFKVGPYTFGTTENDPFIFGFIAMFLIMLAISHFSGAEINKFTYLTLVLGFIFGIMASFWALR